ncbi:rhomboid family intramembrane serine protease [Massilia horti]|uniref:Rhomboid family intramembrane serine protease n=1 Tax=Massilia horti TaxID=2562153 RepID=A0A4Y9SVX5_9BURK|nr:rhomboid family intramembrane serine protease [Massilia horti]TFW28886.1 rhomboid family intramembrane serine protease [Massilia horti]
MKTETISWRLHSNAVISFFRATLLTITSASIIAIHLIVIANQAASYFYISLIVALYAVILMFSIRRYFKLRTNGQFISVHNEVLSVPRFFLKQHLIPLCEIKSIERFFNSKGIFAVIIGRINKSSIIIERRTFESSGNFEDFVRFIDKSVAARHPLSPSEDVAALTAKREAKRFSLSAVLGIVLFLIYLTLVSSNISEIRIDAIEHGGLIKETLTAHDFYRLASSFFLHYSPLHLGFNILALAIIARNIEIILGNVRFVNILFFSAASGSLLSLLFSPYQIVAGASGGIFGLFGAYLLVSLKYQKQLPGSVSVPVRILAFAFSLQILLDLTSDGVDVFSHIGGFIFGFFYAWVTLFGSTATEASKSSFSELCAASAAAFFYIAGLAYFLVQFAIA